MAIRNGLGVVVGFVARLINDTDYEFHTPEEIQDTLDGYRWEARYLPLTPIPSVASGGATSYTTFQAPQNWRYFETAGTLYNYTYTALTPTSSDWTNGRWVFAAEPTQPVTVLGWSHDPYNAAADLLEVRASQVAESYDSIALAHGSFSYAARRKGPLELAAKYRLKGRRTVSTFVRGDVNVSKD